MTPIALIYFILGLSALYWPFVTLFFKRRVLGAQWLIMSALMAMGLSVSQTAEWLGYKSVQAFSKAYKAVREIQPFILEDTPFYKEIDRVTGLLKQRP